MSEVVDDRPLLHSSTPVDSRANLRFKEQLPQATGAAKNVKKSMVAAHNCHFSNKYSALTQLVNQR
jgi:hypothetical protein